MLDGNDNERESGLALTRYEALKERPKILAVISRPMETTTKALASAKNKKIVLISHDLTQTGSPLLLIETAVKLREAGAHIELVSLADKTPRNNAAARIISKSSPPGTRLICARRLISSSQTPQRQDLG